VKAGAADGADAEGREEYRSFFNQTYARFLSDGAMYFGVEASFVGAIGRPLSIELAKIGFQSPLAAERARDWDEPRGHR